MQLTEIDKARDICDRALKTMSFREVRRWTGLPAFDALQLGEKKNVWIARLNLENAYGTKETLGKAFKECIQ